MDLLPLEKDPASLTEHVVGSEKVRYVAGIDEAGRGPVLGPMVYGLCYTLESEQDQVKNLRVADSKTLTAERRSGLFQMLNQKNEIGWNIRVLDPMEISNQMYYKKKVNLNTISHQAIVSMIRKVQAKTRDSLCKVWIDTVGPPDTLRLWLSNIFPTITFVVSKKADSLYPMVSAASILAKVVRDDYLERWVFVEDQSISREFGSGYPADPVTVSWMKNQCDIVFGYPRLIRFSWSTAENAMADNGAAKVIWPTIQEQPISSNSTKRIKIEEKPKPNGSLLRFFGSKPSDASQTPWTQLRESIKPWIPR
jgi:ribonuclease H2 subunit A